MVEEWDWHFDETVGRDATTPRDHSEPRIAYKPQVTNGRGATLLRIGLSPAWVEDFFYRDGEVSFKLSAHRFVPVWISADLYARRIGVAADLFVKRRLADCPSTEELFFRPAGFRSAKEGFTMTDTYTVVMPRPYRRDRQDAPIQVIDRMEKEVTAALKVYPPLERWVGSDTQPRPLPPVRHVLFF